MFVYPTWWSGLPAVLKGWLERVMVPGVGFTFDAQSGKVQPGLRHVRRIVGISTYGSPWTLRQADQRQRAPHPHPGAAHCRADGARARRGSALYAIDTADDRRAAASSSNGSSRALAAL